MAHELSEKRKERLKDPYLQKEVLTIRLMTEIYCRGHHGKEQTLCPECRDFADYAVKRIACCPYGRNKPVCKKCKIHCFQKSYKDRAREIMAYAGPRLLLRHPVLSFRHLCAVFRAAPNKPSAKTHGVPKDDLSK
jgi:hypothetical protein